MTINYKDFDLGLKRTDVKLVPHSLKWSEAFSLETARLKNSLSESIPQLKFHHIGSTAISGIVAKPIIDILGEVDDISFIDQVESTFKNLGYEYKGEYGISGRRYLTLYSEDKETAFIHMHIFESSSKLFDKHLIFRDILNSNEKLRLEYQALKLSLIENAILRSEYSNAKALLIERILASID